jgi:thiol:disulfide interchange protein DsbA
MKQLLVLFALLLALSACSKQEEVQPPAAEQAPAEAPAAVAEEVAEPADEASDEVQEVVEESAAVEEEAGDEPIVLAMADDTPPPREWKYEEGEDYFRLVPTQPTVGGADRIEVAELFMYTCPHCRNLEPALNRWVAELPPDVRFVRIPAMFNRLAQLHAQLYYTAELLAANGSLDDFDALHTAAFDSATRLTSREAAERLFARFGVSSDEFNKTWNSFSVNQKMRVGGDLSRRYNVSAVPTIVVNGKYRVPNTNEVLNVVDELLIREGLR